MSRHVGKSKTKSFSPLPSPAASLHEFKSSDDVTDPEISIFLPGSTVSLLSEKDNKKNPYCIEIRGRNNAGYISREKSFIFKANSLEEQQDWYNKLTEASNRVFTTGPAPLPLGITPMEIQDSSTTPPISPQLDSNAVSSPTVVRASKDDWPMENTIYPPLDYQQKIPALDDGSDPAPDEEAIQEKIKRAQEQSANPPAKSILGNSAGTIRKTTFNIPDSPIVIRQAPPLVSPIPKHAYTGPYQPQLASVHKEAQIKPAPVSVDEPDFIEEAISEEEALPVDDAVEGVAPVEAFPNGMTSSVENTRASS